MLLVQVSIAGAEDFAPTHSVDGSYIKEWLVLGPFPSADLGTDFLAGVGGEEAAEPREGDAVVTAAGDTLIWQAYRTYGSFVDFNRVFGERQEVTAYAYCTVHSEMAGEAGLVLEPLNYRDPFPALWLNGGLLQLQLRQGANGLLLKSPHGHGRWGFTLQLYPPERAVVSGVVVDEAGEPVSFADIHLYQDGSEIARTLSDWGEFQIDVYPADGTYQLSATEGTHGSWQRDIDLRSGYRVQRQLVLRDAVQIRGTALMADGYTPHVAVPVQALRLEADGAHVVQTALTDEGGEYQFVNLAPGRYQVRCQVRKGHVYYIAGAQEHSAAEAAALDIDADTALSGIDFVFTPFKKGTWKTFNSLNGLTDNLVFTIHGGPDGTLWFGSRSHVSYFDGNRSVPLQSRDNNWINALDTAVDGTLWIGADFGAMRYEGDRVEYLTDVAQPSAATDSLARSGVLDLELDPDGTLWLATTRGVFSYSPQTNRVELLDELAGVWINALHCQEGGALFFATRSSGVVRYDGRDYTYLTASDGLASDYATAIDQGPDGILWLGTAAGLSRYDPRTGVFTTLNTTAGLVYDFVNDIHVDGEGVVWVATDGGVSRYDGATCAGADEPCSNAPGTFVNYTAVDGLADDHVWDIYQDRDGHLWFACERGGVSRYDRETFVNFTAQDGLVGEHFGAYALEPDGTFWLGSGFGEDSGRGVFRFDGERFVNFTTADGLAHDTVYDIERCPDGSLWFATVGGGVSRYDGENFETLTSANGLVGDYVSAILCEPDGTLWFGTGYPYEKNGVSRYDGETFSNFTREHGLGPGMVFAITRHQDAIWVATGAVANSLGETGGGAARFNGERFEDYTTREGWPDHQNIIALLSEPDGTLWVGTSGAGLVRYDGQKLRYFTTADGLADPGASSIFRAADGNLWLANNVGASTYDGHTWSNLDTRDGLSNSEVTEIFEDAHGNFWLANVGGITRYRRSTSRPTVRIDSVYSDGWARKDLASIPAIETGTRIAFSYRAIDFKTVPEKRQYRCRIREVHGDTWLPSTRQTTFEWTPESSGTYTFEVQAIDRDLRYSEPARLTITVTPQYGLIALWTGLGLSLIALALAGGYGLRRRRERDQIREQLVRELEREMQTAHELQMSLMPSQPPQVPGLEVAGQCVPATEVGGDIFHYFPQQDKFALSVADVTGHGMQAAVPVMTFSGILNTEMQYEHALETLFAKLNATLHQSLERRTFICFAMGEVDLGSRVLRLSNCGLPYPLHYRAATREVGELQIEAFPLGIRPRSTYEAIEVALAPGDRVVFYSDGLVEAANEAGEFFGFARIAAAIGAGCAEGLSAQNLLQRVFGEVRAFSGAVAQDDDQTLVVLHVAPE